jgi:hypothetical protein
MFDAVNEIIKFIDTLYGIAEGLDRGQILTHEQIREVLGVAPHEGRWDYIMSGVRRRIERERGIATWPVVNVGYELLTNEKQLELPRWRFKRGIRQIRRGRKSLEALPEDGLTVNQRRVRHLMIEYITEAEQTVKERSRAHESLLKPSFTQPRQPVPTA